MQSFETLFPSGFEQGAYVFRVPIIQGHNPGNRVAVNSTNTLTASQVVAGYVTSTSAAATTLTLPTGASLGAALGLDTANAAGTTIQLYVDNTAGASVVLLAAPVSGGALSAMAASNATAQGSLGISSGSAGLALFEIIFTGTNAYLFSRQV